MSSYAFGNFGPASSINPATVGPAGTAKRNPIQIYRKPADGAGEMKLVAGLPDRDEWLTDWSIDGKYLLFYANDPNTRLDVWAMPADGGKPFPVVNGPADEINGRLSPDGRWLLYTGNESGRNEIYIAPFQHGQGKWLVSTSGGAIAVWGRDGKALYYTSNGSDIWMVPVNGRGDTPELGTPRKLFQVPLRALVSDSFEVTRDGRFLVVSAGEESDTPLTLVQNWPAQLKK
jgi:hypothetical protein